MPHTKSAKKRLRQNLKRRARNRAVKSALKTQIRKVREAIQAGDLSKAEAEFRLAAKKADQAAAKRIIHPNKAARIKSRLAAKIRALKGKTASTAASS
ncbi:MAG: 30S ribosomal protein S20 [Thermoguttaceae bacterium]|nr:30S ribosomal protein S20 [Thermoguttaceae bacterium]MDW8038456.1 30S ribosomal protein S20 [Thermoguttaceae bacterium]